MIESRDGRQSEKRLELPCALNPGGIASPYGPHGDRVRLRSHFMVTRVAYTASAMIVKLITPQVTRVVIFERATEGALIWQ